MRVADVAAAVVVVVVAAAAASAHIIASTAGSTLVAAMCAMFIKMAELVAMFCRFGFRRFGHSGVRMWSVYIL